MTWDEVREWLRGERPGRELFIRKASIRHPRESGAAPSSGLPRGQLADWRFAPDLDCRGLHVHEFAARYRVHLDRVHPACDVFGHFMRDVLPGRWLLETPARAEEVDGLL
jgi:hypothetical protein